MATADQLVLDIVPAPSFASEDYVPGEANAEARALTSELSWPTPVGVLLGEAGSGKSHLAHLFAERFDGVRWFDGTLPDNLSQQSAVIIDGLERWTGENEDALFHTLEAARAAQVPVLVTSREAPENLGLKRPDTVSRLRAGSRATIDQADDALFLAIAVKLFTDRQLMVDPAIADYLLQRMERSYANLSKLIALIDERSLAAGRSITKPLARDVLAAYELSQNSATPPR
ncbi:MAG: HdaA/DnaA family protein [Hyphomicrobiales bacterium]